VLTPLPAVNLIFYHDALAPHACRRLAVVSVECPRRKPVLLKLALTCVSRDPIS